jgi:predicted RNA polymerase sigma factor
VVDCERLIFTCCHPALSSDARVALTLREVCGFTTEEIAHAFLVPLSTLAQRIVRAKAKIRDARIPSQVPVRAELPDRLDGVLRVIYLVFNEGYVASSGATLTRPDWGRIVGLFDLLLLVEPSPVVSLNRAVAVAMRDGAQAGLALIDAILERGELVDYHLAHAARADLCRRLGHIRQARVTYERALSLTNQPSERRFLLRRLEELPI